MFIPRSISCHDYRLDALDAALDALDLDLLVRRVRRSDELSEPMNQLAFWNTPFSIEILTACVVGIVRAAVSRTALVVSPISLPLHSQK
jgi:hypothetical protein